MDISTRACTLDMEELCIFLTDRSGLINGLASRRIFAILAIGFLLVTYLVASYYRSKDEAEAEPSAFSQFASSAEWLEGAHSRFVGSAESEHVPPQGNDATSMTTDGRDVKGVDPTVTLISDGFEDGTTDHWRKVSPEGIRVIPELGTERDAGLAINFDGDTSYLYKRDLTRSEEAYLSFWFDPNDAVIESDGSLESGAIRIASVGNSDGIMVALRLYSMADREYRACLEWTGENGKLRLNCGRNGIPIRNEWQRITIGYLADEWVTAALDDGFELKVNVEHAESFGTRIALGKIRETGHPILRGTILFDDVELEVDWIPDLWVSAKTGNDLYSGRSPEEAFGSIQKAADTAGPGTIVHILPGVYRETVRPAMSGNPKEPIRYVSENGPGTVFVRGSIASSSLTWTRQNSNDVGYPDSVDLSSVYAADLSRWSLKDPPRFLVEMDNDNKVVRRLEPAREPDLRVESEWKQNEYWWMANGGSAVAGCDPTSNPNPDCDEPWRSFNQLTDTEDDDDPAGVEPGNLTVMGNLTGAQLVAMDASHAHYVFRQKIIGHNVAAGRITLDEESNDDGKPGLGWGSKYYVENHPALLDQEYEWWFDESSGYLYLWAPGGQDPGLLDLEISTLDTGFDLTNRSHIVLDGITIELFNEAAYRIDNENSWHKAHGNGLTNALLRYANSGVILYQFVSGEAPEQYAVDGFWLEDSEIAHMDTTAIGSDFWWPNAPDSKQFTFAGVRNTVFKNNEFHHLGFKSDSRSAVGIRIFFPDRLRFENNHLHHVAQNGAHLHLSLNDSDRPFDLKPEEIKLGDILVKDNVIEKSCLLGSDCGGLKIGGSRRPFTHIFRNVLIVGNTFRDINGWSYVSIKRGINSIGDGNGLYIDHASGIHAYRNIAYNNTGAGFKAACLWRDGEMIFYNNIAANNYSEGFELTGASDYCDNHNGSVNTQLINNILINNDAFGVEVTSAYDDGDFGDLYIDHNLYFENGWNEEASWNPAAIRLLQGSRPAQYLHDLNEIQAETPWERDGVEGDPEFLQYEVADRTRYDGSWPDFHITAASANALDQGSKRLPASLAMLLNVFGVDDTCFGSALDIGRFEAVGALIHPAVLSLEQGASARLSLESYPPSFPEPVALEISVPPPGLSFELSSDILDPGMVETLTVTDSIRDYPQAGVFYKVTVAAVYEGTAQYSNALLLLGGTRTYLPLIARSR